MVTDEKVEQLLERITALENRVDELEQEKAELKEENNQLQKENKRLRAKVRRYGGRTHHRARTNRGKKSRPRPMRTRTTNSHVLTAARLLATFSQRQFYPTNNLFPESH